MATSQTIRECVKVLFDAPLANKPENMTGTINVFMATLSDIDDGLLKASIAHCVASEVFFPAVATIRKTAVSMLQYADNTPDAYTAWQEITTAVRRFGSWRPQEAEASLTPLALKSINAIGGLKEFGQADIDDHTSWRARFISCYEQYQRRQADDAMMLPAVAGYIQQRRELNGQSVGELVGGLASKMLGKGG